MRILLVNQHAVPIFIDVVNAFSGTEHEVSLLTGYIEKGGVPLSAKVRLQYGMPYNRQSKLTRLWSWLWFSIQYGLHLLWNRYDRIVVVTNPPLAPVLTYIITRVKSMPYYLVVYDLYPNVFVQTGLMSESNFWFRRWQKINTTMFSKAAGVITLSQSMREAVWQYGHDLQITVVPNWADHNYIKPVEKKLNPFVAKFPGLNKTCVLYAGNMGLTHDLESLVQAAEILRSRTDIQFVLMGDGGKKAKLAQWVAERQLPNVLFLNYQNEHDFPLAMAAADISVVTLGRGAEGISVPSKTYVSLAAGLCLLSIAPLESELGRLIMEHEVGVCCEPERPAQVAMQIQQLVDQPELLKQYQRKALGAARQYTPKNANEYVRLVLQK